MKTKWMAAALAALMIGGFSAMVIAQDDLPTPGAKPKAEAPAGEAIDPAAAQRAFNQQLSYTLGLNIGRDMKQNQVPIDPQALMAGLTDALSGAKPKMTEEQCQAVMQLFSQQMQQKQAAQIAGAATANEEEGTTFLTANAKKEGVQTTASGLQYRVVKAGTGESPTLENEVRCHYEGKLINGEVFDSSYKRGEPAVFPVGRKNGMGIIEGWMEVLQLMKPGAKYEVYIPGKLAYGEDGRPPTIGPNQTLIFTIELLEVL